MKLINVGILVSLLSAHATDAPYGEWRSFWECDEDVKNTVLKEYGVYEKFKKEEKVEDRNFFIIGDKVALVSGIRHLSNPINIEGLEIYDFCDVFLGKENSATLKNSLNEYDKVRKLDYIDKTGSLSKYLDMLFVPVSKDQNNKFYINDNSMNILQNVDSSIFLDDDVAFIEEIKERVNAMKNLQEEIKPLIVNYLDKIDTFLKKEPQAEDKKELINAKNIIKGLIKTLKDNFVNVDKMFEILNNQDSIRKRMHTETLYAYILQEERNIGDVKKLKDAIGEYSVFYSEKDMCDNCEKCLNNLAKKKGKPIIVASSKEYSRDSEYSYIRHCKNQNLIKIPIDADNKGEQMAKLLCLLNVATNSIETKSCELINVSGECFDLLRQYSSKRMQAFFPSGMLKDFVVEVKKKLESIKFEDVYTESKNKENPTNKFYYESLILWPLLNNIEWTIFNGIRAHQLVFTEVLRNKRGDGIEKMKNLLTLYENNYISNLLGSLEGHRPKK